MIVTCGRPSELDLRALATVEVDGARWMDCFSCAAAFWRVVYEPGLSTMSGMEWMVTWGPGEAGGLETVADGGDRFDLRKCFWMTVNRLRRFFCLG